MKTYDRDPFLPMIEELTTLTHFPHPPLIWNQDNRDYVIDTLMKILEESSAALLRLGLFMINSPTGMLTLASFSPTNRFATCMENAIFCFLADVLKSIANIHPQSGCHASRQVTSLQSND